MSTLMTKFSYSRNSINMSKLFNNQSRTFKSHYWLKVVKQKNCNVTNFWNRVLEQHIVRSMCSKCFPFLALANSPLVNHLLFIWSMTLCRMRKYVSIIRHFKSDKMVLSFQFYREYQTGRWCSGVARNFSQGVHNSVIVSDLQPTSFTVSGLLQLL